MNNPNIGDLRVDDYGSPTYVWDGEKWVEINFKTEREKICDELLEFTRELWDDRTTINRFSALGDMMEKIKEIRSRKGDK